MAECATHFFFREKIIATVQTDEQGRWELELDNRYDYTCSIHAVDEENQEYIKANEEASAEKIDKAKNYLDFHTSLTRISGKNRILRVIEGQDEYIRRCRSCGKELPIGAVYNYCDRCHAMRVFGDYGY